MAKADGKRSGTAAKALEGKNFEEVLGRLEEIVDALEVGELPLEKSLALFEEGVGLAREGHRRLEAAERRVTELTAEGTERPLLGGEGAGGEKPEGDDDDDDGDDDE